jgi:hypothetical protein
MSSLQQKVTRHTKKQKRAAYMKGNISQSDGVPAKDVMADSLGSTLAASKMFGELRKDKEKVQKT